MDVKQLMIFDDLYHTRSVTQTAERFRTNQPSISMSLAKLRRHFNDPLFVKTRSGMEPTPHAREIARTLGKASELFHLALGHLVVFDPSVSERTFHLTGTDVGQAVILPKLMNRLEEVAPRCSIEFHNMSDRTVHQLETGEADLALGFIREMKTGFCRQKLFADRFICAARADHPRLREELTLRQFQDESLLVVTTPGTGHGVVEQAMRRQRIRPKVRLRIQSFLGLPTLMMSTDMLVIMPERLARIFERFEQIRLFEVPFKLPSYPVMQYWHERFDRDQGNRWLRRLIAEVFQE
jgi:DNA-binding transcriptional LysR family regulator